MLVALNDKEDRSRRISMAGRDTASPRLNLPGRRRD
jgi:hypothetical protein